jgi:DnaJ-class molecular chaperone
MKTFLKSLPDQLVRLVVAFAIIIGGALTVRAFLPASLKDSESHVRTTVERETARPVHYAGTAACAGCHEQVGVKNAGYHRNLSCETCHGPAQGHVDDPGEVKPNLPRLREFCVRCHAYNPSRPTGFPQINPAAHNPLKPCISCHDPHDPKPPSIPHECAACHAEIARTKSVSPHVLLECTTCHSVPGGHKVTPRAVMASIPSTREFCARCHGLDATMKETPKVDLDTHGEKYLCWDCHYPHMPEVQ